MLEKIDKGAFSTSTGGGKMDGFVDVEVLENVTNFELMCIFMKNMEESC